MNITSLFHSKPVPILVQALKCKGRKISHKKPWPQWNPEIYKINYRYNSPLQCIGKTFTLLIYIHVILEENGYEIVNQLLFSCEKYLRGLREPHRSDYFSLQTSSQIHASLVYYLKIICILITKISHLEPVHFQ